VLADVERVDPDGIGEDGLLDGVADDDVTAERLTRLPRSRAKVAVLEGYRSGRAAEWD